MIKPPVDSRDLFRHYTQIVCAFSTNRSGLYHFSPRLYSVLNYSLPLIPILRPLIRSGVRTPASRGYRLKR
jgi:hypothetical protein